jgi:hypothetical protein
MPLIPYIVAKQMASISETTSSIYTYDFTWAISVTVKSDNFVNG